MAKDWEYYKNKHLEDEIRSTNRWLEWIETNIESPIERIAFMHLIFLSNQVFGEYELVVTPQVKIGPYRVDFLLRHWDTDTWIVIECDGHDFHEKTKQQAEHDKRRDRFLTKQGYIIFRYTGSQICNDPMEIYEDVGSLVMDRKKALKNMGE